jgi:hypothetical protein
MKVGRNSPYYGDYREGQALAYNSAKNRRCFMLPLEILTKDGSLVYMYALPGITIEALEIANGLEIEEINFIGG